VQTISVPIVIASPGLAPGVFVDFVLQTSQQPTGGTASTVYVDLTTGGDGLGDMAFQVDYDIAVTFDYAQAPRIEGGGAAVSITEATCPDVLGRIGGGGGGLSYVVGCHYCDPFQ